MIVLRRGQRANAASPPVRRPAAEPGPTSPLPNGWECASAALLAVALAIVGAAVQPAFAAGSGPIVSAALVLVDGAIAAVLTSRSWAEGRSDLAWLGAAFLVAGGLALPPLLGTGLEGPAASLWWLGRQAAFGLAILPYGAKVAVRRGTRAGWFTAGTVALGVALAVLAGSALGGWSSPAGALSAMALLLDAAALGLCLGLRARTVEQLWAAVLMLATVADVGLAIQHGPAGDPAASRASGLALASVALARVLVDWARLYRGSLQAETDSRELLVATLSNIDQGLIKVAADRKIELANRRFADLLDLPADLLRGPCPHFDEVIDYLDQNGEFVDIDADLLRRARDKGKPLVVGVHERVRPNGKVIEVRTVPLPDGSVVSTYADITARRKAERALSEAEARWSFALENAGQGVWDTDIGRQSAYYSPSWKAMIGYTEAEIGTDSTIWLDLVHPEDRAAVLQADIDHRDGLTADFDCEFRMRHKLGHWVWIHDRGKVVRRDALGRALRMIGTHTDISARKNIEQELRVAKERAEAGMVAKAEFLANMSHELRTPLTGMLGVHDLLRQDKRLSQTHARLIELASESGRSLLTIVNDILDFSKIEAGQLSIESIRFDLRDLVDSCIGLADEQIKQKPIRIRTVYDPTEPGAFLGDPTRLRQVLMNLLTNAVKFTERGQIDVAVLHRAEPDRLRIEVTDTGIGIPAGGAALLFERFTQADTSVSRRYGGTGLGLAICKRLLDLMHGRIGGAPRPGGGSTFWFELPLPPYRAEVVPETSVDARPRTDLGCRILLAEDNPINGEIIRTVLVQRGHSVRLVTDGQAAIDMAPSGFDLVLMDVQMPILDGLTAAAAIRLAEAAAGRVRIPIIGLTANAMDDDVERCLAVGMDAHVAKPIDWTVLFATIDRVVGSCPTAARTGPTELRFA